MLSSFPEIGCCGWSESKPKYFADFQVIELQSTFYDLPKPALAAKWRALAPASFHFCLKAWQLITHAASSPTYRKLKSRLGDTERALVGSFQSTEQVQLAWERTADIGRALRAAVILFQCPASFTPESSNIASLRRFFSNIDRFGFRLAWEPRGGWPSDLAIGLCDELQLLRCIDPFDSAGPRGRAPYWRLHGRGSYGYRYSDEDLSDLERLLVPGQNPEYVFFNNIWMRDDALRFRRLLSPGH